MAIFAILRHILSLYSNQKTTCASSISAVRENRSPWNHQRFLADTNNNIYYITRARKNYTNYTQTLHLTLHLSDLPCVTKCIVCASNYTQTLHLLYIKPYTTTVHRDVETLHETERKPCTATASRLAWRSIAISCGVFLFNQKNFATFASEIDPASFEVRLEPSFREADTLWKSPGLISNPFETICWRVYTAS